MANKQRIIIPAIFHLFWYISKFVADDQSFFCHESLLPCKPKYNEIAMSIMNNRQKVLVISPSKMPKQDSIGIPFQNPHKCHKENAPQLKSFILFGTFFSS